MQSESKVETKLVTRPDSSLRYRRYINRLLTYILLSSGKFSVKYPMLVINDTVPITTWCGGGMRFNECRLIFFCVGLFLLSVLTWSNQQDFGAIDGFRNRIFKRCSILQKYDNLGNFEIEVVSILRKIINLL